MHAGDGFDIHAVLQRQRGESVPQIVKADGGQLRPLQHPVQHMADAVRRNRSAAGRGEHILTDPALLHLLQHFHRILGDGDVPVGVLGFKRDFFYLSVDPGNLPFDMDHAVGEVDVLPLQSEQLAPAQAGGEVEIVQLVHAALFRFAQEGAELLGVDRTHLPVFHLRKLTAIRGVGQDQFVLYCHVHGRRDHLIDVPHRFRAQAFGLLLGFDAGNPPLRQQLLVELLEREGGQLLDWDLPDVRLDVVLNVALVGLV